MAKTKVAVTLDAKLVDRLNTLVRQARFRSRSQAIEVALEEMLERLSRVRLSRECAKLDPREERGLAEEGSALEAAAKIIADSETLSLRGAASEVFVNAVLSAPAPNQAARRAADFRDSGSVRGC